MSDSINEKNRSEMDTNPKMELPKVPLPDVALCIIQLRLGDMLRRQATLMVHRKVSETWVDFDRDNMDYAIGHVKFDNGDTMEYQMKLTDMKPHKGKKSKKH